MVILLVVAVWHCDRGELQMPQHKSRWNLKDQNQYSKINMKLLIISKIIITITKCKDIEKLI